MLHRASELVKPTRVRNPRYSDPEQAKGDKVRVFLRRCILSWTHVIRKGKSRSSVFSLSLSLFLSLSLSLSPQHGFYGPISKVDIRPLRTGCSSPSGCSLLATPDPGALPSFSQGVLEFLTYCCRLGRSSFLVFKKSGSEITSVSGSKHPLNLDYPGI